MSNNQQTLTGWGQYLRRASVSLEADDALSPQSTIDRRDREKQQSPLVPGPAIPAAVLVGFTERREGINLVLTRRSAELKAHRGQIAFPGGKIDRADSSPRHTALREAEEEIGINSGQMQVIGKLPLYETGTGFIITPITALIEPPYQFVREEGEVDEIFEVPLAHILNHSNYQQQTIMIEGIKRSFWAVPYQDYYIWGATAAILYDLAGTISKQQ